MSARIRSTDAHTRLVALTVALALLAGGCARLPGGGQSRYTVTAIFPEAVALYEQSQVKLIGANVGTVRQITLEDRRVVVEMTISEDVPLPADVHARIAQLGLLGERNVVLFPAWQPGMERLDAPAVIPPERTSTVVEPDEVLQTFDQLAEAIDPDQLNQLIVEGAEAVDGHGELFNATIGEVAELTDTLAEQDRELLKVAENFHQLASTLNERTKLLDDVLNDFATAVDVLADERQEIRRLIDALVGLIRGSEKFIAQNQQELPTVIARATELAKTLRANLQSVDQLVATLPENATGIAESYRPELSALAVRVIAGASSGQITDTLLAQLGISPDECVELLEPLGYDCGRADR